MRSRLRRQGEVVCTSISRPAFQNLSNYLFSPYQFNVSGPTAYSSTSDEHFVTLYAFHGQASPQVSQIQTVAQFSEAALEAEELSTLLFLRGHQPPEILNAIGARYRVDPEYWRRHLEVHSRSGRLSDIASTCLNTTEHPKTSIPHVGVEVVEQRASATARSS